eukprot:Tbor_TRINITY_DN5741_c1_g1::TRINITY_DN5741_c1_g1_i9::g.20965::m.20965
MALPQAPFLICFIPQFISVVGDTIGSRASRVYITKQSRRRFLFALVFVSSIQMFIGLSILQLAAPVLTTPIYKINETTSESSDWCKWDLTKEQGNHKHNASNATNIQVINSNDHLTSVDNVYDLSGISQKRSLGDRNNSESSIDSDQHRTNVTLMAKKTYNTTSQSPEQEKYCFPQGPLSIPKNLLFCPMLLINGVMKIFYYTGEASLYKHPVGVLLIVLSALASSFLIAPIENIFHLEGADQANVWAALCGIVGAVLCLVERTPPQVVCEAATQESCENSGVDEGVVEDSSKEIQSENTDIPLGTRSEENQTTEEEETEVKHPTPKAIIVNEQKALFIDNNNDPSPYTILTLDVHFLMKEPRFPKTPRKDCSLKYMKYILHKILSFLPVLGPFSMLAWAVALYFVLMKYYNNKCAINIFGYNAFDQVSTPFYIFPFFLFVDLIKPIKRIIEEEGIDQEESFLEAFKGMLYDLIITSKGLGLLHVFVYRLLINGRAMIYSYIAITYDLSSSYLELTLIRVVLSWMASLIIMLVIPSFIRASHEERRKVKDWVNVVLKLIGTAAVVCALFILKH